MLAAAGAGAVLLVGAAPAPARAQLPAGGGTTLGVALDAGYAHVDYDDFLPSSLVSAAGLVRLEAPSALLVLRGSAARYESTGNLNAQGAASASAVSPAWRGVRAELGGELAAGSHETVGTSAAAQLRLRLHAPLPMRAGGGPEAGVWVGATAGWSAFGGTVGHAAWQGDAGAWARWGRLRGNVALRPARAGELRYADAVAAARWTGRRLELGAEAGLRAGDRILGATEPGARRWAAIDAAWSLSDRLALVGAAGRTPVDPIAGVGGGSYAALSLHVSLRGGRSDEPPRVLLPRVGVAPGVRPPVRDGADAAGAAAAPPSAAGAEALTVAELGGERVRLRLVLPGASRVEIAGDFTDWEPQPLRRAGDAWIIELALGPGVHRVNVRVDGGAWRVPPTLTAVDDGFGGRVGLLVVR